MVLHLGLHSALLLLLCHLPLVHGILAYRVTLGICHVILLGLHLTSLLWRRHQRKQGKWESQQLMEGENELIFYSPKRAVVISCCQCQHYTTFPLPSCGFDYFIPHPHYCCRGTGSEAKPAADDPPYTQLTYTIESVNTLLEWLSKYVDINIANEVKAQFLEVRCS